MTAPARPVSPALGALAVSLGGALGAVARWSATEALPAAGTGSPWPTFLVNVAGAALLAALPLLAPARRHAWVGLFAGTGLLGGFTTMSAASLEAVVLVCTRCNTTRPSQQPASYSKPATRSTTSRSGML